jgi:hypothetical protein
MTSHRIHTAAKLLIAAATVAAMAGPVAAEKPTRATIAVQVDGAAGVPSWRRDAIAGEVRADLGEIERLDVVTECPPGDAPCAEVLLYGVVDAEALRYELRFTWPTAPSRVHRGAIPIARTSRRALAEALYTALDPLLRPGAALDRRGNERDVEAAATIGVPDAPTGLILLALALVAALLAGPFVLGRRVGIRRLASFRVAIAVWIALGVGGVVITAAGDQLPQLSWLILFGAGLAWGWFAVSVVRLIVPTLAGLSRVEYGELLRYLRPWFILTTQRLARVALWYAPFVALLHLACVVLEVSLAVELGILLPLWGLLLQLVFAALVEVLTLRLDQALIEGAHGADNPWQIAARGYFKGYVKRVGWPDADGLIDDVRILPGRDDPHDDQLGGRIVTYGGGMTPSRIVVPAKMLEMALAPYGRPHDYAAPRISKLAWTEWNAGLVIPVEVDAIIPTREQRQPREEDIGEETEHQPLGEPPTVAGYIEPDDLDKRNDYRPEEDPLWLDWDAGEEYDGTDASDKDFLFGGLVRELGSIQRHDDQLLTLELALGRWARTRSAGLRKLASRLGRAREVILARYPTIVADEYAALNFARHHLIQYVAWQQWHDEEQLSARAYAPELERHTVEILTAVDTELRRAESTAGTRPSAEIERLAWLSTLVRAPIRSRREQLVRRAATAAIALGCVGVLGLGVAQAIGYHDTYLERMEQERARLEPQPARPTPPEGSSDHDDTAEDGN